MLLEQAGLILLLAQLIKLTIVKSHRNYFTVDQYEGKSVRKFPTLLPRQLQNYFGNQKAFKLQEYIYYGIKSFLNGHSEFSQYFICSLKLKKYQLKKKCAFKNYFNTYYRITEEQIVLDAENFRTDHKLRKAWNSLFMNGTAIFDLPT